LERSFRSRGKPKNFLSFLVRPPDPPPQGGKGKEGNFWFALLLEIQLFTLVL